ncbi:MAG: Re/Si-specific NAD(P)(+) transhydrogenase subunit alpha [Cyanobacteria bacterium P01_A01_bin.135]
MRISVVKESSLDERRVALTPDVVGRLVKSGLEVAVETAAGEAAFFTDAAYQDAGATVTGDTGKLWGEADIVLTVCSTQPGGDDQPGFRWMKPGAILIGFMNPLGEPGAIQQMAEHGLTVFPIEMVPRSTRAQSMDALSSQASLAGYKAVLIAAASLPKFFPMLTTAAGTIRPAKVFVMGAGVAGLQAIATARRLGAVVEGYDIRPEVKEQVQSLGAKFVELVVDEDTNAEGGYAKELSEAAKQKALDLVADHVSQADVVITTAQVPGRKAPLLVTEEMVSRMKPGSVIVDLAAGQGGNCACSEAGKDVVAHGVTVIGPTNLPASMPVHASQTYAKNLQSLLKLLVSDGQIALNFEDDIISGACAAHGGEIRNARIKGALEKAVTA